METYHSPHNISFHLSDGYQVLDNMVLTAMHSPQEGSVAEIVSILYAYLGRLD